MNAGGCIIIKPVVVALAESLAGTITPVTASVRCNGDSITLTASGGTSYQWFRNDTIINGATSASYIVTKEGIYTAAISNGTCTAMASNKVTIQYQSCIPIRETKVFVPTAFTPNKNGANDDLQPYFINVKELVYFKVYNRWGQQVFQTNIIGRGWDGTIKGVRQPLETYTWILECVDFDGKVIKQSGRSLLLR